MKKRRMVVEVDEEIFRVVRERQRAVPLEELPPSASAVLRDLIRAGVAASPAPCTKVVA